MADRRHDDQIRFRLLMGLGFDSDGHHRVTKGEDFLLLGGSEKTHERMQEEVDRFRRILEKMGTDLQDASPEEVLEAAHECGLVDDEGSPRPRF